MTGAPRAVRALALLAVLVAACRSSDKPAKQRPRPAPRAAAPAPKPAAIPMPGPIDVAAFDHTCAAPTDCVVVKAALCDPCGCAADAIASSASAAFDEAGYKLVCPPPDLTATCAPCPTKVAACVDHRCVAR
jgi:hypothetical protein